MKDESTSIDYDEVFKMLIEKEKENINMTKKERKEYFTQIEDDLDIKNLVTAEEIEELLKDS